MTRSDWAQVGALAAALALAACAGAPSPARSHSAQDIGAPGVESPGVESPEAAPAPVREAPAPDPEPAPSADEGGAGACVPRGPPLPLPLCQQSRARLEALLAEYDEAERSLGGVVRCQPLAVEDLEEVRPSKLRFGDLDLGPGFFGDPDIDGDAKPDVIRLFTSVDYWGWLLFVRDRGCLRFVDSVYAYQLEPLQSRHHGVRDLRVLTYPVQGRIEKRKFDGKAYVP